MSRLVAGGSDDQLKLNQQHHSSYDDPVGQRPACEGITGPGHPEIEPFQKAERQANEGELIPQAEKPVLECDRNYFRRSSS